MTELHDRNDAYEQFRDDFGARLVATAEAAERSGERGLGASASASNGRRVGSQRRLRSPALALGAAAALGVAVLAIGLPTRSEEGGPALGLTPAAAAVTELRDALREGVLIRRAVNTMPNGGPATEPGGARQPERWTEEDWTDLATRERRTRIRGGSFGDSEYWNPNKHERWEIHGNYRAKDGRPVLALTHNGGAEHSSSSASPLEEIDDLLALTRSGGEDVGKLTLRKLPGTRGRRVVIELQQKAYSTPDEAVMETPDPARPNSWPNGAQPGMRPVLAFQRWWIKLGANPQLERLDNGVTEPDGSNRVVVFASRYDRWQLLPATDENLALVRPPAESTDQYFVVEGGVDALADATRAGEITCSGQGCPPLERP